MRRTPLFFATCLLLVSASARAEMPAEAARALAEAEKKFYETGQEKGTRAAFLEFLAEDGIVFRPGPVSGKEVWGNRSETGLDLVWEPTFAAIARSADFGYDTGPAKWRANRKEEKFTGHGQFISIWKKQTDGSWKVALDCGIENPEPGGASEPLHLSVPAAKGDREIDIPASRKSWEETQNSFVTLAKFDFTKALGQFASEEVRLFRDGSFPARGKEAATRLVGSEQAGITLDVINGDISNSADLAYYYGRYQDTRPEKPGRGHFLQIWQTDRAGTWKLVLDWAQPLPETK